ncbi:ATP-grasp domain-containing protein [Micromonospora echinospora]|uniref:ATP-grasp domain-containing protein n=1 Tax=Micromonospora echinospora TaxID=1877 RepID=UPI003A8ABFB8
MSDVPRYLVLNRFGNEFGEYHRYLRPHEGRMAYLTLAAGTSVLDTANALDTVVVADLDLDTVLPAARALTARLGPFSGVVGISEWDLLTAARLREALGVPGWSVDFVRRFRDKPYMKERVAGAGLRTPRFVELVPGADPTLLAEKVAADLGLPVIVKPRAGVASAGVLRVDTVGELAVALSGRDLAAHECEEFVDGRVLHVDGVRLGGHFHFVSASTYVNTCFAFANGAPLGSVLLDHGPLRDRVTGFAARCLDALDLVDGPFHLELFHTPDDELVFLEVGLRPGGGPVPDVHRELFGIDLLAETFRTTVGLPPATPATAHTEPTGGGWLIFPEPRPLPSRVVARTSPRGEVDGIYAEVLPEVGEVFDGTGGYLHVGGTFRFHGPDEVTVRRDVRRTIERYRLTTAPVR